MKTNTRTIAFLISILTVGLGAAEISFSCGIYNTNDYASESMSGENIAFDGGAALDVMSISLQGSGEATGPQSYYSFEMTGDGEYMQSAGKTDSGHLAWNGKMASAFNESEAAIASMAQVHDGLLETSYANQDFNVVENVRAMGSEYRETAKVSPKSIFSSGEGETYAPGEGQGGNSIDASPPPGDTSEEHVTGFSQCIAIEGFGKQSWIESEILGNASESSLQWLSMTAAEGSKYSVGMIAAGNFHDEEDISSLEMVGFATDFPTQRLPAVKIDVERLLDADPNSTIDKQFIEDVVMDFNRDNSINQSLYHEYNISQSANLSLPEGAEADGWDREAGVFFNMKMVFEVEV